MPATVAAPSPIAHVEDRLTWAETFSRHWREYLIEAGALACFMISACVFGVLLEHPASVIHLRLEAPFARRMLAGMAMGATAIALVRSPWGQRSGAHMNPAVTLAFFLRGKVRARDAFFYVVFQFLGGYAGVAIAASVIGPPLGHQAVNYVVTRPGASGSGLAFAAEFGISALLMLTVLVVSNHRMLSRFTPLFAGGLIALFIAFESPVSGMSMNPARTLGSAIHAADWTSLWIYFVAPPLGMTLAAQLYRSRYGLHRVLCAKLAHHNLQPCIFRCRFGELHDK